MKLKLKLKKLADLNKRVIKRLLIQKKNLLKVISEELKTIKDKFSVPRRTKIIDAVLNYDIEETIQKESVIITVTLQGYIKRGRIKQLLNNKKEAAKVKSGITTREADSVIQTLSVNTHTSVLIFFNRRTWFTKSKLGKFLRAQQHRKVNLCLIFLPLKSHQSISSIMPFPENDKNEWKNLQIVFATAQGKST